MSGKPADLFDTTNPDWLPTVNLGNSNEISDTRAVEGVCSPNHRGRMREGPGAHLSDETQTPPRSRWPK